MWIDDAGGYRVVLVSRYERLVDEWLKVCSVLIVFTCGMAGWGYKMLSIRYCNSRISRRIMDEVKVYYRRMNFSNQIAHPKILIISNWVLPIYKRPVASSGPCLLDPFLPVDRR